MSTVKNFKFTLWRRGDMRNHTFSTTARTLAEAQADFRHHLRTHHHDVLDDIKSWGYNLEVSHV